MSFGDSTGRPQNAAPAGAPAPGRGPSGRDSEIFNTLPARGIDGAQTKLYLRPRSHPSMPRCGIGSCVVRVQFNFQLLLNSVNHS
ncbi:hypothetical protein EVAR_65503_1 [Eumeta japonica]|uniref:Uncharacterized protein n=1 Tax=Eumeta variegata TaxID=151549 RepID=A0A4C2AAE2_EUMVA|nr:hypothetical protein EVAR_65503_1 [Eumeta japonica]